MSRKKWCVAAYDRELVSAVAEENGIDPFVALLLCSRGITDSAEIDMFCNSEDEFCDPFDLVDMELAVERISDAIDSGEKIAVYGDYDADGVTATALLAKYLLSLGCDVVTYIPDRNSEGYGLNTRAVDELATLGVNLIITVDNGISACKEAEYIASKGIDLVITDHHKCGETLPDAVAVVNPHRKDCYAEFNQWSGVGVAFKLVCAIEGDDGAALARQYADLVAIGTIADVVPLVGENRTLVKHGIRLINSGNNRGVTALRAAAGVDGKTLNSVNVAFSLVPRINAIGRMGRADDALTLLMCDEDVDVYAEKLDNCNAERQSVETEIMRLVELQLETQPELLHQRVLIVDGDGWHPGVIGIVAARLVEKYGKPSIVISNDGEFSKGSGRSIEGFSLYNAINSASDLLTHFGGHTLAAGFSLGKADVNEFRQRVNSYARTVDMPYPCINIDCKLRPESLNSEMLEVFSMLEPFGACNPQPMFGLFGMKLVAIQPVGNGKHLRLIFSKNNVNVTAMRFSVTPEDFPYELGDVVDLAVRLEKNEFRGEVRLSVQIRDIRPSGSDDVAVLEAMRIFDKIMCNEELSSSQIQKALPTRAFIADVYRLIRKNGGWRHGVEALCLRLGDNGSQACRVTVALEAMLELGLIIKQDKDIYVLPEETTKVELSNSKLLQKLGFSS